MANSKIKVKMIKKSFSTGSITTNTNYTNKQIDVSMDGYTPVAVIGWQSNQAIANLFRLDLDGNTLNVGLSTIDRTNLNNCSIRAYVLYI